MRNKSAQHLFEYWTAAKADAVAPLRKELEPRAMKLVLPWVFILERIDRELAPFRLAGTGICAQYEQELAGTNFLSLWLGDCRRTMRSLLENVATMPAPAYVEFEAQASHNCTAIGEVLLLPLFDDAGEVHQILGGWFSPMGRDATFDLPLMNNKIRALRILDPEVDRVGAGLIMPPRPVEPKLRLVVSNT